MCRALNCALPSQSADPEDLKRIIDKLCEKLCLDFWRRVESVRGVSIWCSFAWTTSTRRRASGFRARTASPIHLSKLLGRASGGD